MPDALLVGNNLAVLVAAAELGAAGRDVVLLTDGRPAGGHFRGLRVQDTDMDIGMVLLEQGGEPGPSAVRYPTWRATGPACATTGPGSARLVDDWQQAQVSLVRTPTPEVLLDGRRWPDHLIADRSTSWAPAAWLRPPGCPGRTPGTPPGRCSSPAYDTLTYAEAAEVNHGAAVHGRLVAPFAEKLLGSDPAHCWRATTARRGCRSTGPRP